MHSGASMPATGFACSSPEWMLSAGISLSRESAGQDLDLL
jgi:hypothetical protein